MKIMEYDGYTLVITYMCRYDFSPRLTGFDYEAYILERNKTLTKSEASISCSVHTLKCGKDETIDYIYINDIKVNFEYRDRGIGSVLMNEMKSYAKGLGANYISGRISFVDIGTEDKQTEEQRLNSERVWHFYKKHGFEIYDGERIYLSLKTDKAAAN